MKTIHKPYVVVCRKCGKEFYASSRHHKVHEWCRADYKPIKKVYPKYPAEFHHAKGLIRARDHHTCQLCGKDLRNTDAIGRNPPVHHIDGDINNNDTKNLVTLCDSCHFRIHGLSGLKPLHVKRINVPEPKYTKPEKREMFYNIA